MHRPEELDALTTQVKAWIAEGVSAESIAVAARTRALMKEAAADMFSRGSVHGWGITLLVRGTLFRVISRLARGAASAAR